MYLFRQNLPIIIFNNFVSMSLVIDLLMLALSFEFHWLHVVERLLSIKTKLHECEDFSSFKIIFGLAIRTSP
jgi:hypothetical protein